MRRVVFDSRPDFAALTSRFSEAFPALLSMSLSYLDDEGDEITVATDVDLAEAFIVTQWPDGRHPLHFSDRANDTPRDLNVETEVTRGRSH
jgi:hypothetical protein